MGDICPVIKVIIGHRDRCHGIGGISSDAGSRNSNPAAAVCWRLVRVGRFEVVDDRGLDRVGDVGPRAVEGQHPAVGVFRLIEPGHIGERQSATS